MLGNAVTLVAGENYTCALMQGGTVKCWGQNSTGQLGDGTTVDTGFPVDVVGLTGVTALAAGFAHSCALAQGAVNCWGANPVGQLGDGTLASHSIPGAVAGLPGGPVTALATGDNHTCAAVDGAVYCWGSNRDGQLGDGTEVNQATPAAVQGITGTVRQLGEGASHSCGLTESHALYCWGGNEQSQLGDGTTADRSTAALVSGLAANVLALYSGGYHNCVLVTGNRPLCWGNDSDGQLASGVIAQSTLPIALRDAPPPRIELNTINGQPGSIFTLIGRGFAADELLPVVVNGTPLTATISSNQSGEFIAYLDTEVAEPGTYNLLVGNAPPLRQVFLLPADGTLRLAEGGGTTILLPAGVGEELEILYLPIVAR